MNSRLTVFSCGELTAGMNLLGICIARDGQKRCCCGLDRLSRRVEAVLYADHVRFDLAHPYIERLPTL